MVYGHNEGGLADRWFLIMIRGFYLVVWSVLAFRGVVLFPGVGCLCYFEGFKWIYVSVSLQRFLVAMVLRLFVNCYV